ncbi:MAG: hypothetical protein ACR2N7_02385 [Acidimicrobiia bacterium]
MTIFVAFVLAGLILAFTVWSIRFIASGPPPEPDLDDVVEVDVPYLCTVCGLSLTITQAQDGEFRAPKHCREEMVEA